MPFSGGSSGQVGVTAHLHTNSVGDGGSLNDTSLINDRSIYTTIVAGSNMNIVSVTVQTGAAGVCVITGQMTALPKPTLPEFGSL